MRVPLRCLAILLLVAAPLLAKDEALARLSERYRKWLGEEVIWILTEAERKDFLQLANDDERDAFISRFWKIRDSQPLTAENEFKDEHYRRLAYANKQYGSETARRGWQTDRGRVYILLGKPDDVERQLNGNETYPYEMWFYGQNTARLGLPSQLRLLFYRPFGTGEFRLLNPAIDRERLFPPTVQIDINEPHELQQLLGPEVSQAIDSVAPGYGGNVSDQVIAELRAPRDIPQRIHDRGLALHPEVHTRFALERLELPLRALVVPGQDGAQVHLGAELPPAEVTFQEGDGNRFLARVDVFGEITDARGVVVAQFDEAASLAVSKADLERRKSHGFAFETVRTLIPGRYRVSLNLQDYGRGKLGQASGEIEVPKPAGSGLGPLSLALKVDNAPGEAVAPFTVAGFKLTGRPGARFRRGEPVYALTTYRDPPGKAADLDVDLDVRRGEESVFHASAHSEATASRGGLRPLLLSFSSKPLAPGSYQVVVSARAGQERLGQTEGRLEVTDAALPPGYFLYTETKASPPEVEHYNRGLQFLSSGDFAQAEQQFRLARDFRPGFRPATVYLARTLLLLGRSNDATPLIEGVLAADPDNYDALVTRGTLGLAAGDFAAAAAALERARAVGARTKELLNAQAEAAIGLKDAEAARRYLRESLELDPRQDATRSRLQSLGG